MDQDALCNCLRRLLPHVDDERIAITGGVAIGIHIAIQYGDTTRATAAEDIDFVAATVEDIRPSVTNDFLVSHFHLPRAGDPKFLVQLVDPAARLRLDFFPDTLNVLTRARTVDVAGVSVRMLEADDILEHTLRLLTSAEVCAEEKHYVDAIRLGAICRRDIPSMAASQLVNTAYSHDLDATCPRCESSRRATFPLAPKRAIFDVLGYV